jgi:hypothetical protein
VYGGYEVKTFLIYFGFISAILLATLCVIGMILSLLSGNYVLCVLCAVGSAATIALGITLIIKGDKYLY